MFYTLVISSFALTYLTLQLNPLTLRWFLPALTNYRRVKLRSFCKDLFFKDKDIFN